MNSTESAPEVVKDINTENPYVDRVAKSPEAKVSPRLSHQGLTIMLALMCIVPIVTIAAMWAFLPKVQKGTLHAEFAAEGLPQPTYYDTDYRERDDFKGGQLVVRNLSDEDWTHLNININRHYQIYDKEPIPAYSEKRYNIDRFVSRSGARFSLRYNPLLSARIYARLPSKNRATFECEFKDGIAIVSEK